MILLCPPEKSTQFHYPLDPKKIRPEGSIHKDTTYQGSDRQDFYRHGKKKKTKKKKTNKLNEDLDWVCLIRQPSKKTVGEKVSQAMYVSIHNVSTQFPRGYLRVTEALGTRLETMDHKHPDFLGVMLTCENWVLLVPVVFVQIFMHLIRPRIILNKVCQ